MPKLETNRAKLLKQLAQAGWQLVRSGKEHDIYVHGARAGVISLPRHRTLSPGVARSIAETAGWI